MESRMSPVPGKTHPDELRAPYFILLMAFLKAEKTVSGERPVMHLSIFFRHSSLSQGAQLIFFLIIEYFFILGWFQTFSSVALYMVNVGIFNAVAICLGPPSTVMKNFNRAIRALTSPNDISGDI